MRSGALWHPRLVALITGLGHTETIVVADAGLPVPPGVEIIDLLWARRQPPLAPVLAAIAAELVVEAATIAEEARDPDFLQALKAALPHTALTTTSHEQFKNRCAAARAIVRTGEDTPYANVMLHAGVPF